MSKLTGQGDLGKPRSKRDLVAELASGDADRKGKKKELRRQAKLQRKLKKLETVRIYVVRYLDDGDRLYHRESLNKSVARATARLLTEQCGYPATVQCLKLTWDEVDRLFALKPSDCESIEPSLSTYFDRLLVSGKIREVLHASLKLLDDEQLDTAADLGIIARALKQISRLFPVDPDDFVAPFADGLKGEYVSAAVYDALGLERPQNASKGGK